MASSRLTRDLYLDLMKRSLLGLIDEDPPSRTFEPGRSENTNPIAFDRRLRENGWDFPSRASTMIGAKRIDNIRSCIETVLRDSVPGDLIETGVWRGGATIFMRAVLKAHAVRDRTVWVADSFDGVPMPNAEQYPADHGYEVFAQMRELAVPQDVVSRNFAKYDLLDDQVRFLPGLFKDTLHASPIDRLAVLRADGDLYESTMDALKALYPRLSTGGFCIIDDYEIPACVSAVGHYRDAHGIREDLVPIDEFSVFWRKEREIR